MTTGDKSPAATTFAGFHMHDGSFWFVVATDGRQHVVLTAGDLTLRASMELSDRLETRCVQFEAKTAAALAVGAETSSGDAASALFYNWTMVNVHAIMWTDFGKAHGHANVLSTADPSISYLRYCARHPDR